MPLSPEELENKLRLQQAERKALEDSPERKELGDIVRGNFVGIMKFQNLWQITSPDMRDSVNEGGDNASESFQNYIYLIKLYKFSSGDTNPKIDTLLKQLTKIQQHESTLLKISHIQNQDERYLESEEENKRYAKEVYNDLINNKEAIIYFDSHAGGHANAIQYKVDENGNVVSIFYNAGGADSLNKDNEQLQGLSKENLQKHQKLAPESFYPDIVYKIDPEKVMAAIEYDINESYNSRFKYKIPIARSEIPHLTVDGPATRKFVERQHYGNCAARSKLELTRHYFEENKIDPNSTLVERLQEDANRKTFVNLSNFIKNTPITEIARIAGVSEDELKNLSKSTLGYEGFSIKYKQDIVQNANKYATEAEQQLINKTFSNAIEDVNLPLTRIMLEKPIEILKNVISKNNILDKENFNTVLNEWHEGIINSREVDPMVKAMVISSNQEAQEQLGLIHRDRKPDSKNDFHETTMLSPYEVWQDLRDRTEQDKELHVELIRSRSSIYNTYTHKEISRGLIDEGKVNDINTSEYLKNNKTAAAQAFNKTIEKTVSENPEFKKNLAEIDNQSSAENTNLTTKIEHENTINPYSKAIIASHNTGIRPDFSHIDQSQNDLLLANETMRTKRDDNNFKDLVTEIFNFHNKSLSDSNLEQITSIYDNALPISYKPETINATKENTPLLVQELEQLFKDNGKELSKESKEAISDIVYKAKNLDPVFKQKLFIRDKPVDNAQIEIENIFKKYGLEPTDSQRREIDSTFQDANKLNNTKDTLKYDDNPFVNDVKEIFNKYNKRFADGTNERLFENMFKKAKNLGLKEMEAEFNKYGIELDEVDKKNITKIWNNAKLEEKPKKLRTKDNNHSFGQGIEQVFNKYHKKLDKYELADFNEIYEKQIEKRIKTIFNNHGKELTTEDKETISDIFNESEPFDGKTVYNPKHSAYLKEIEQLFNNNGKKLDQSDYDNIEDMYNAAQDKRKSAADIPITNHLKSIFDNNKNLLDADKNTENTPGLNKRDTSPRKR